MYLTTYLFNLAIVLAAIRPEFQAKPLLNPSIVGYAESNIPAALLPTTYTPGITFLPAVKAWNFSLTNPPPTVPRVVEIAFNA